MKTKLETIVTYVVTTRNYMCVITKTVLQCFVR